LRGGLLAGEVRSDDGGDGFGHARPRSESIPRLV
jgi:hypothetical protein